MSASEDGKEEAEIRTKSDNGENNDADEDGEINNENEVIYLDQEEEEVEVEVVENEEEEWKDADFLSFGATEPKNNENDSGEADVTNNDQTQSNNAQQQKQAGPAPPAGVPYGGGFMMGQQQRGMPQEQLPPWMDTYPVTMDRYRRIPPLVLLHNEIVDFANLMKPQEEEIKQREELIERITKLAESIFRNDKNFEMRVFGSQATGLFLPTSDIDLVLILPDEEKEDEEESDKETDDASPNDKNAKKKKKKKQKKKKKSKLTEEQEMESWDKETFTTAGGTPLSRLAQALQDEWKDELSYLEHIENTRIPIVKFTHSPTNLSVDVCCNQSGGPESAELMKRFMESMPPLRPLTFVLKYFMASRGTNEPYFGGAGSFMLQMMIVSFLQHREREEHNVGRSGVMNLGSLLLEFFELYGMDFNYVTTGISVRSDGFYFPKGSKDRIEHFWQPSRPFSLALEAPFDITADVGRGTYRMQLIQRSFEVAFRTLMAYVSEPVQPAVSILRTILPPTEEMDKRAVLLKVARVEQALKIAGGTGMDMPLQTGRGDRKTFSKEKRRETPDSSMSMSSEEEDSRYTTGGGRKKRQKR